MRQRRVPGRALGSWPHAARLAALAALAACLAVAAGLLAAAPAGAATDRAAHGPSAEDEACLGCHDDPTFYSENSGARKLLHVEPRLYGRSVHAGNGCTSCHADVDPDDLPHDTPLAPVDCGGCHDEVAALYAGSTHGKAWARGDPDAPRCDDCHSKHQILPPDDHDSWTYIANIPRLCGACHREGGEMVGRHAIGQHDVLSNYSMSIHGKGLFESGLTVTAVCTSCHTTHHVLPHDDPASSINRANIAGTCMQCHGRIETVHRKVIRGELWEKQPHLIPACVECHAPHEIRRVKYEDTLDDAYCMECHGKPDLVRAAGGRTDSLFVNRSQLLASAHGGKLPCVRCHLNMNAAQDLPCRNSGRVDCSMCHASAVAAYQSGIHGQLAAAGNPNAPDCRDCHGTHAIRGRNDLASPIFARNVPDLCAKCHREGQQAAVRYQGPEHDIVKHYDMSIHGKGLHESGLMVTAVCSSCHTGHRELPASDPQSSVNPHNIAETCAQCHLGIYETFKQSVHSPSVTHTDRQLPVCNDCHLSHEIERVDRADFRQQILRQCGSCHPDVAETYFDTYHGKVSRLGYAATAKCSDCHGSHGILPPEDPRSTLSPQHIVATCKHCHPESNRKFTGYLTHATHHDKVKYPILFYTFWSMTLLLVGTFSFFGLHTLLWIPRSFRQRLRPGKARAGADMEYVVRFEPFPRILHIMVIVSFLGLALTGMTLKFAANDWAVTVARSLGGFESTGTIHRVCAIITFLYFVLHFIYVGQKKQRSHLSWWRFVTHRDGILPGRRDFREFAQTMRWFFGRGPRPAYGRWTYWEKFDYCAVFWGVAVIGSTGLMLWFPEFFTRFLPGHLINVATIIHSDEALLATGFIFSVHFFNTHFRPEKFPMDPVIFTGAVPLAELEHDRPQEYAQLVGEHKRSELLAGPPPRWLWWSGRIFGTAALVTGMTLVVMIVWSMIFQYR